MNAVDSLFFIRSEIFLAAVIFVVLILDFFIQQKRWLGWLSVLSILIAFFLSPSFYPDSGLFFNYYTLDPFGFFFKTIAYLTIGLTLLASLAYEKIPQKQAGEFYVLLLTMALLLTFMGGATNLLMIFLTIESVSLTSYLLTGFQKFDKRSSEASLKYVLFGAVSSAVMLFGMSLLFGASGTIELSQIGELLKSSASIPQNVLTQTGGANTHGMILMGMLFLMAGIGFKISMVPFHMWAPDVYQGAPTPVTAFLTVAPKALGVAVMARVLFFAFPDLVHKWAFLMTWISIATMTIGNVIAISQSDIKRLLAYSSIAQAGYILAGLATPGELGLQATLIYIAAYLLTNLGAFFTVIAIERNLETNELEAYNGLSVRNPLLALVLTIFLLSLAGIPPLAGFIGKIYIFSSAIKAHSIPLALSIALNSAVAAYYYFNVVKAMYLAPPKVKEPLTNPFPIKLAIGTMLFGTFLIGLWPSLIIQAVVKSLANFPIF
ncbi:MAG: hypothetical protein A3C35_05305 [Omnitrophica bacterium RIFCSPHIGHO2_02_FULL_46_11]|nr:MAG: hypothetical protein A3C35_05305 [Omnitrophica bacterium RIFCSPHIGHO2_02_FULL_46_11]